MCRGLRNNYIVSCKFVCSAFQKAHYCDVQNIRNTRFQCNEDSLSNRASSSITHAQTSSAHVTLEN